MNSKLLSYEDAKKKLKPLEDLQREAKKKRKYKFANFNSMYDLQGRALIRKKEINYLLSIIAAHKVARKLYGELEKVGSQLDV